MGWLPALVPVIAVPILPAAPAAALDLPNGVTIGVEFPRHLRVDRDLEVIVDNQSDTALTITSLTLRSPLFDPVEPRELDGYIVRPGRRNDFRIDFGAAVCPPPAERSHVELAVEIAGIAERGVEEIDDEPLRRISEAECGERFVFESADITISEDFDVDGDALVAAIDVTRRASDEPITVEAVRSAVLYGLEPTEPDEPLAVLDAGSEQVSIPVTLRVIRCDPHAAADIKIPFAFSGWVTVGDRPTHHITIPTPGPVRVALEQLLVDCLVGTAD